MVQDIVMPKLGLTMSEGTLARWIVPKGEPYKKGDPLFEAVTDKISFTVEAATDGTIIEIVVNEGETVPVGAVVARAEVVGEGLVGPGRAGSGSVPTTGPSPGAEQHAPEGPGRAVDTESHQQGPATPATAEAEIVRASPAAKKLAREHNIDLAKVPGTGPGGRVVEGDVRAFLDRMLAAAADVIAQATGARGAEEAHAGQTEVAPSPERPSRTRPSRGFQLSGPARVFGRRLTSTYPWTLTPRHSLHSERRLSGTRAVTRRGSLSGLPSTTSS